MFKGATFSVFFLNVTLLIECVLDVVTIKRTVPLMAVTIKRTVPLMAWLL